MRNRFTQLLVPVLIFAFAISTFANCGDDNDNDIPAADTTGQSASISLKVDSSTLTFPKGGGTQTVTVTSPSAITVLTNAQWLQAVLKDNDGTSYIYDITADICTAASDRTGEITLLAGSEKATITATQRSTMSQTITVDAAASSFTIDDIPASVEVTCDALWISQNGNSFATSANTTNSERTGLVVIKFDSSKDTVFVTQKAGSVTALSMQSTAMEIAAQMYPAWNLGNTMEATGSGLGAETSWQRTKTTQDIINLVKASGFRAIRIPCSWYIHCDKNDNYKINADWMARVKEVVDYCINAGLYIELNDHWDSGWIEVLGFSSSDKNYVSIIDDDDYINSKIEILQNLWTQIATEFKDYDQHLIFGGLNEPFQEWSLFNDKHAVLTPILEKYNQAFVDAVRATGGNNAERVLAVQGPSTNIASTVSYMHLPTDKPANKLMVEVHYYDPYNFTINGGTGYSATWNAESSLKNSFASLKAKFSDNGVPVLIGEYAANWREVTNQEKHDASVKAFYKAVSKWGPANGLIPFAWDTNYCPENENKKRGTGGTGTIIDRANLKIYGTVAYSGIVEGTAATVWMH